MCNCVNLGARLRVADLEYKAINKTMTDEVCSHFVWLQYPHSHVVSMLSFWKEIFVRKIEDLNAIIYPNPFQDQFTIEYNSESSIRLEITDLFGKVFESRLIDKSTVINSTSWAKGVYIVSLWSEGKRIKQQEIVLTR